MPRARPFLALSALAVLPAVGLWAQAPPSDAPAVKAAPANPFRLSPEERERLDRLAREDHADMMRQLGITKLRPGYNGRAQAGEPNAANYDPAKANPYPDWPDVLTLKDGRKVTTAEMWWQERRPEIALDFEREVYGRVPEGVPEVTWAVAETVETTVGGQPVVARRVIGHVDNSVHPEITVDIKMAVVVPVQAEGPVPVLIMFGWGNMPDEPVWRFPGAQEPAAPPSTEQLIAAGWGYVSLSPASIQPDNGAGLTAGIIGLTNEGKRRTPEQWGALRAWAWGAARALDYLETLPAVDAQARGHRGGLALRQGRPRHHGLRAPFRGRPRGVVGRGRRQAAPPPLRGGGGEPHGIGCLPLDGRQLPEVRRGRGVLREQERERHPGRRPRAHRAVRAAPDLHQLRRPGEGRRELAGPAGQLHGHGGGGPGVSSARGAGPRRDRGLPRGEEAARQHRSPRRRARLAPARRRARGPLEHELLHRLGEPTAPVHAAPGSRRPAADAR